MPLLHLQHLLRPHCPVKLESNPNKPTDVYAVPKKKDIGHKSAPPASATAAPAGNAASLTAKQQRIADAAAAQGRDNVDPKHSKLASHKKGVRIDASDD